MPLCLQTVWGAIQNRCEQGFTYLFRKCTELWNVHEAVFLIAQSIQAPSNTWGSPVSLLWVRSELPPLCKSIKLQHVCHFTLRSGVFVAVNIKITVHWRYVIFHPASQYLECSKTSFISMNIFSFCCPCFFSSLTSPDVPVGISFDDALWLMCADLLYLHFKTQHWLVFILTCGLVCFMHCGPNYRKFLIQKIPSPKLSGRKIPRLFYDMRWNFFLHSVGLFLHLVIFLLFSSSALKTEVASTSEMLLLMYQTTQYHIWEHFDLNTGQWYFYKFVHFAYFFLLFE